MPKKPTGKIAGLPVEARLRINRALLENRPYTEIVEKLLREWFPNDDVHALEMNLQRWFKGPFQAWRREELERDALVRLVENIEAQMTAAGGMDVVARSLLLEQMTVIRSSAATPEEKAAAFVAINRQLESQKQGARDERKLALLEANAASAKEKLAGLVSKGGLTPETLAQIEEAAKLL